MPCFFFFNDTATTEIYTLSLHDALPISRQSPCARTSPSPSADDGTGRRRRRRRRRSTPIAGARSEEHTSELQSLAYLVCRLLLEKKKTQDSMPRFERDEAIRLQLYATQY